MTTSRFNNHERWHNVEVIRVTQFDSNDWCGIITKEHGEIRCKKRNKTRFKLKKGFKGPLTIYFLGGTTATIADDTSGHLEVTSHWNVINPDVFNESDHGFLYIITNKATKQRYVGVKTLYTSWKRYTSSSSELNDLIKEQGHDNFSFDILFSCPMKGALSYFEAFMILKTHALCGNKWYNKWVHEIKFKPNMEGMEKQFEIAESYS
jgi:hypothetical protein